MFILNVLPNIKIFKRNSAYPPISELPMSEVDLKLLTKFHFPSFHKFYVSLGPKYNLIFNRYRSLLPHHSLQHILDIILRSAHQLDEVNFLAYLKEIGTYTLKYIIESDGPVDLRFFLELQNLSGYDTLLHKEYSLSTDTLPFTTILPDPSPLPKLIHNINKVVDNLIIRVNPHTYSDYIRFRDNWNVEGASTIGTPLTLEFASSRTRKINTKYLSLLSYSDDTLIAESLKQLNPISKPFMKKDEAFKARTVIGYDTWSYLRSSYLDSFIDYSGVNVWSTLGADPNKKYKARQNICQAIADRKYMLCVDQSAFDQHQPKDVIIYTLRRLFNRIIDKNPQSRLIAEIELASLENVSLVIDPSNNILKPWARGLLSGYKFTALLGSLLNEAEFLTVCDILHYKPEGGFYQGDDSIAWFNTPIDKTKICQTYSSLGFEVNPLKTWYSTTGSEFLREIYIKNTAFGVPSRSALALIFSKPKVYKPQPDAYLTKNIYNILKAKRRGLLVDSLMDIYLSRFLYSHYHHFIPYHKFTRLLRSYLSTPQSLGGLGFYPFNPAIHLTSLVRITSRGQTNAPDFKIISPLHYNPIPNFHSVIERRIKDRIQLSNYTTTYLLSTTQISNLYTINHSLYLKSIAYNISSPSLPPSDWLYPNDSRSADYYKNKLSFSLNNIPIPTELIQYQQKHINRYIKFLNFSFSFDDFLTTQETHLQFIHYINNLQRHLAFRLLRGFSNVQSSLNKMYRIIYSYYNYLYKSTIYSSIKLLKTSPVVDLTLFKNLDTKDMFSSAIFCRV